MRLLILLATMTVFFTASTNAHAIDRHLKLMFKTAGYGAAAGFVIGAGTTAMGMGDYRNMLMGASAGMYAGILLAAYIVATKDEGLPPKNRPRNPYSPRRSVGPDDYDETDEDDEDLREHLPPRNDDESGLGAPGADALARVGAASAPRETGIWLPVVSVQF